MDSTLYFGFILVSFLLIIVPGPNVLVIVSTSISHGKIRGLQTVAGTSTAMILQLIIAAAGTSSFINLVTEGFVLLKWLGVAYLLYLALMHLKQIFQKQYSANTISSSATFSRGFFVSLVNPKTILFFSAFLPQFVSSEGSYLQQITLLSITFLVLAVILDSTYAILSSKLRNLLLKQNVTEIQNGFSGLLYLGAGAWLAALRRV